MDDQPDTTTTSRKRKRTKSVSRGIRKSARRCSNKERTHAVTHATERYLAATSTVCGIAPLFEELLFVKDWKLKFLKVPEEYDLADIMNKNQCQVNNGEKPETSCKCLIEHFLKKQSLTVEAMKEVAAFKALPQSVYTNKQVPDVVVYMLGHILMVIEVHSCDKRNSFVNSIKKTVLGVIDILRYYKGLHPEITKCTGFCFPKFGKKKCVVEVAVQFINFTFAYSLKFLRLDEVKTNVLCAIQANKQRFRTCFNKAVGKYTSFVTLSSRELKTFKCFADASLNGIVTEDIVQYPSKEAILLSYNGWMWKFPARKCDKHRLEKTINSDYTINLTRWIVDRPIIKDSDLFYGDGWFYYRKIEHAPMIPSEARECVGHFMKEFCPRLHAIHVEGFVHLDVRLENICFNNQGQPIIIDLDRCSRIEDVDSSDINEKSCMYGLVENEQDIIGLDWKQVGLLLLWIYGWEDQTKNNRNYHTQDVSVVNNPIVNDDFFLDLMEGKYTESLLDKFVANHSANTMLSVLKNRVG